LEICEQSSVSYCFHCTIRVTNRGRRSRRDTGNYKENEEKEKKRTWWRKRKQEEKENIVEK
jgi:hypothetical protein